MDSLNAFSSTPLTSVRRHPERANFDEATVMSILDARYSCSLAFVADGQTHCLPMAHWRIGRRLYIHGSNGSRLLRSVESGQSVALCVTLEEGLVLAKSAFHHSMNYRSAIVYGSFSRVLDESEKSRSFEAFMEKVAPGRWSMVRPPSPEEMAATTLLYLDINEAVAKIRTGPPVDKEGDLSLPVWSGVLPILTQFGEPLETGIEPL